MEQKVPAIQLCKPWLPLVSRQPTLLPALARCFRYVHCIWMSVATKRVTAKTLDIAQHHLDQARLIHERAPTTTTAFSSIPRCALLVRSRTLLCVVSGTMPSINVREATN